MKTISIFAIGIFSYFFLIHFSVAQAASNTLPEMLAGMTTIEIGGQTIYGGNTGNYAVLNYDQNSSYGFRTASLIPDTCIQNLVAGTMNPACFFLGIGADGSGDPGSGKLLTSRTSIKTGTNPAVYVYETPALFMGGINVSGDVYDTMDASNFAFWGRNLVQNSTNSGASWQVTGPAGVINPEAQSSWASADSAAFKAKANVLRDEAEKIPSSVINPLAATDWYLQASSGNITTNNSNSDMAKFPDGKIWESTNDLRTAIADLNLAANVDKKYHGTGTLIVQNLTLGAGASITPASVNDHLGIIVYGNLTLAGNNEIDAPIICISDAAGKMNFNGNNITLKGSFIAKQFVNLTARNNISILYDYNLDGNWPPGFKYLKMPSPKEVGNQ